MLGSPLFYDLVAAKAAYTNVRIQQSQKIPNHHYVYLWMFRHGEYGSAYDCRHAANQPNFDCCANGGMRFNQCDTGILHFYCTPAEYANS